MEKYRLRLQLSYRGTDFYGWQKQPNQSETIQGHLERALSQIFNEPVRVVGSGRTDRGTHALVQWAHGEVSQDPSSKNLQYALNRLLPEAIRVHGIWVAPTEFHAQRSALCKKYIYKIHQSDTGLAGDPFRALFYWQEPKPLHFEALSQMASLFLGEHDFSAFQSSGTEVLSPKRHILKSYWKKEGSILTYHVVGTGFLKQMVRNLVGAMVTLQNQQDTATALEKLQHLLASKDRQQGPAPAPAHGLYLKWVKYPEDLDNKCRKL